MFEMIELPSFMNDLLLLAARVMLGATMVYYGLPKVKDLKLNAVEFDEKGFKPGIFWGTIVAFVEFFGGISIIIGLLSGISAFLFGIVMILGTYSKITKAKKPFTEWSYDIILLSGMIYIIIVGPGAYSLNTLFF